MFVIEDELHTEPQDQYPDCAAALEELHRRARIPWDKEPNMAPCVSWQTCGRKYELIHYDDKQSPWKEVSRIRVLEVSADGTKWADDFGIKAEPSDGKSLTDDSPR